MKPFLKAYEGKYPAQQWTTEPAHGPVQPMRPPYKMPPTSRDVIPPSLSTEMEGIPFNGPIAKEAGWYTSPWLATEQCFKNPYPDAPNYAPTPVQPPHGCGYSNEFLTNDTHATSTLGQGKFPLQPQLHLGESAITSRHVGELFAPPFGTDAYTKPAASDDEVNDPPLLEELGIRPECILQHMCSVLFFFKTNEELLLDVDMCGPLFIAACLGGCLLLAGKVHFGYIYGLSITGSIGLCLLLNLMSPDRAITVYKTVSILGYALLPVVFLATISIFFTLRRLTGVILSAITVIWCTATASRFFEAVLEMKHQRFLVAYPVFLLYGCFVLITVF